MSELSMKPEGTDVNFTLATQTGVSKKDAKPSDPQPKMTLTPEEQDILDGKRIVTVDMLGDEFLDAVKTGNKVKIYEDGTVEIED